MRKQLLVAGIAMLCLKYSFAQNADHSVISSAGEVSKTSNIQLEWTLGEAVAEQGRGNDFLLTQGFNQSFIKRMIVLATPGSELLSSVAVAPNPVKNDFTLLVNSAHSVKLQLTLTDASGQILQRFSSSSKSQLRIDMTGYTPGFYLLRVAATNENVTRTFKIIKVN